MFACIHASADAALLVECAQAFSPVVEQAAVDIAVLDASGLDRIYGPPHEIAAAIVRHAQALGFAPHIALASNPDTAICAARGFAGVSVVPHGDEAKFLESLPLHLLGLDEELSETFARWGIRTFRDLAVLPPIGIAGRLGAEGVRLQKLAQGDWERPLVPLEEPLRFEEEMELEYPVELLEPLSFVLGRLLGDLCRRLAERGLATNEIRLRLALEDRSQHERTLRFPVPMCDPRTFLKLMQLDLGSHPPAAAVVRVWMTAAHTKPRPAQGGLFVPSAPEPEKLELTLARVAALVGEENVGSPELLDTHRPDAFRMRQFRPWGGLSAQCHLVCKNDGARRKSSGADPLVRAGPPGPAARWKSVFSEMRMAGQGVGRGPGGPPHDLDRCSEVGKLSCIGLRAGLPAPRLCFRFYRPPRHARVQTENGRPDFLLAEDIRGKVISAAGPWRTSGDWWTVDPWDRDEWDIGLADGALYRIYCEHSTGRWFVEGSFD